MAKRQLTDSEKETVKKNQTDESGVLRCFISGEIIGPDDEIEYDHTEAYSNDGSTDIVNVKVVLKKYNRKKKDESLLDVRERFQLEKLFVQLNNNVKLQDILAYKGLEHKRIAYSITDNIITIEDGTDNLSFQVFHDRLLNVDYFYAQIPLKWVVNDDEEGLQPRIIDKNRLVNLRKHLKTHPQLAPAIARLKGNSILLFDGQHKTAAQILNDADTIDCKVFISPANDNEDKALFDELMITNLDAHSKFRQVPFYTSTLVERFSVSYKELWDVFASEKLPTEQSEEEFLKYLQQNKKMTKEQTKKMISAFIMDAALQNSELAPFIAEASKDSNYPISLDILSKAVLPNCLYMSASSEIFDTPRDHRNDEVSNFLVFSALLKEATHLDDWVANRQGTLTQEQLRARRIWHKGSVLTWGPMLKDLIINGCNLTTQEAREKLLYRQSLTADEIERLKTYLTRIFNHTLWVDPNSDIDSMLTSATKQKELFDKYKLTTMYALTGSPNE